MRRSLILLTTLALLGGCVERAPELSPADRERLREFVSNEPPDPDHDLNVEFDNGVRLLGYDASAEQASPGDTVTVTWYWHAADDLDDGWQIFTHVADGSGENRLNQDNVGVVRELYQPGRWESGQYIRDVQEITVPEDWATGGEDGEGGDRLVIYLGLWKGEHRLSIESGPNDGENRVRALSMPIRPGPSARAGGGDDEDEAPGVRPPPSVNAARAEGDVTIDGALDEDAWRGAGRTRRFVNTADGSNPELRASSRVMWDDEHLYVAFEVSDDFVQNTLEERDAHLWEQDAVEIMVDPDGDGRNYFEMQVSPTGVAFDTRYDTRRQPQPFGHVDWDSDLEAAVNVTGTANDDEADRGYTAEIAIPWAAFDAGEPAASRPEAGATWRMNFYVMDQRPGNAGQRSAGWSPTHQRDFHVPARFGRVTFQPARQAAAEPSEPEEGSPTRRLMVPQARIPPRMLERMQQGARGRREVQQAAAPTRPELGR
ncbi:MAG TPA: carbohydrate-binding family 9-like protein [Sandaracinaceae bacterium LLY-WYZ-13_1]|nr:carbohydrate-binding family 9-like protein [Sandaracinaceae bacterium LLY-WYZ-13_1]